MIASVGAISKSIVARNLVNAAEPSSPAPTPIAIVSAPCASTILRDVVSTSLFGSQGRNSVHASCATGR